MPKDEIAWRLMQQNAEKLGRKCLLCYWGIPGGSSEPGPPHHLKPKGMGGTKDKFTLEDPRNFPPACPPHHEAWQPIRCIWIHFMSKPPLFYSYDDIPSLRHCLEFKKDCPECHWQMIWCKAFWYCWKCYKKFPMEEDDDE